jgi:hypothetical protein
MTKELNEFRREMVECLYKEREIFRIAAYRVCEYKIRLKTWCVTIFMFSAGFCIKEKESVGVIFYFLPFFPVLLFWFHYAYMDYLQQRTEKHPNAAKLTTVMRNIYEYSSDELKLELEGLIPLNLEVEFKGINNFGRLFNKKIPELFKIAFCHLENLAFFGSMVFLWLMIILLTSDLNNILNDILDIMW